MKKICFGAIVLLILFVNLAACGPNPPKSVADIKAESKTLPDVVRIRYSGITKSEEKTDNEYSYVVSGNNSFYYISVKADSKTDRPSELTCYEYEVGNNRSRLMYSVSDDRCDSKDYCYSSGRLLYTVCSKVNTRIEYYDLQTRQFKVLETFKDGNIPSLSCNNNYASWLVENGKGKLSLYAYEFGTKEKFLISEEAVAFSASSKAFVSEDNITAYITKGEEGYAVNVYDLARKKLLKELPLGEKSMITGVKANSRYLVYTDMIGPLTVNCNTVVVDMQKDKAYDLSINGRSMDVCDFLLNKGNLDVLYFKGSADNSTAVTQLYEIDLAASKACIWQSSESYYAICGNGSGSVLMLDAESGDVALVRNGDDIAGWADLDSVKKEDIKLVRINTGALENNEYIAEDANTIEKVYTLWTRYRYGDNAFWGTDEITTYYISLELRDGSRIEFELFRSDGESYLKQYRYTYRNGRYYVSPNADVMRITEEDYGVIQEMISV